MRAPRLVFFPLALAVLASALLVARAWGQTPTGQGVIEGQAAVASQGSTASLGDLPVSLFTFIDGQRQVPPAVAQTDAAGHVRFNDLSTGSHYTYTMFVKFQDTIYSSDVISFAPGSSLAQTAIRVYDTTADAHSLRVDQHHVIIDVDEATQSLDILEFYQMTNSGDRTIVGNSSQQTAGKRVSFHAPLPPDAIIQSIENRTPNTDIFQSSGELLDTVPIAPGAADLVFEYRLPYRRSSDALALSSPYSIAMLNVLVAPGISLRSPRLVFVDNVPAGSRQFQHFSARDVPPNTSVPIELNGLPAPLIPLDVLQWLPLAGASLALVVALVAAYRRNPSHAPPSRQTPA